MDNMENASFPTAITFYYVNGEAESFNVYEQPDFMAGTTQDVRQDVRRFFEQGWWTIKLVDTTVFINASQVRKVEIKPGIAAIDGEGVLSEAEKMTALSRSR